MRIGTQNLGAIMQNYKAIYKAIDFIEKNLKNPITIPDVASAVGYSVYHFSRTFSGVVGHTPYDYLQRRRISEAAQQLINTDKQIIHIAYDYQFNNPETFSRAFKRIFGILPNQCRKNKSLRNIFYRTKLKYENIRHINQGDYLTPKFVQWDGFKVVGMSTLVRETQEYMESGKSIMTEIWYQFENEISDIKNKVEPGRYYSISFFPVEWELNGFYHMVAVEVTDFEEMNPILVGKTIPPSKYVKFIHKGRANKVNLTYDYIFQTWLPQSKRHLSHPIIFEYYPPTYRGPDDDESESEIYLPIK
jgi:AraC family transcriptional regulator